MREAVAVLEQELELFQNHPDIVTLDRRFGDLALLLAAGPAPADLEAAPDYLLQSSSPEPAIPVGAVTALENPKAYPRLFNAEAISELAARRVIARETADAIYEKRMQHLREGEYDVVPQSVDPLSTAARVVQAERLHGRGSAEYQAWYCNLLVDSSRLLEEAGSKGTAAYFLPLRQEYNAAADGYEFEGRILQDMVADGITPIAEPEENSYRIGEYVEEAISPVVRMLGRTMLLDTTVQPAVMQKAERPAALETTPEQCEMSVHTIAECANWALDLYDRVKHDPEALAKADFQGYVPENDKIMIRTTRYYSRFDVRYLEQVAVPGYPPEVILEFNYRTGVLERGQTPDKITRRATQIIDPEGLGALDIMRVLDDIAGELTGKIFFKGQEVGPDHPKDYAVIPAEALAHQQKFEADKYILADYLIELENKGTDHFAANAVVADFVQDLLLEKVKADPEQAEVIFDKRTANNIKIYAAHREAGNDTAAEDLWRIIKAQAPKVEFCTGGSCGLAALSGGSAAGIKAKELLGISGDSELVRDTERACPECHEYEVVYDVNTGSKACLNCHKTEIKK